jgi:hypothetical protein
MIRVPADCLLVHVAYLFYSIQKMDFEEFCVAAISVDQLEGMESWEQHQGMPISCLRRMATYPIMFEGSLCILISFKWQILIQLLRHASTILSSLTLSCSQMIVL